MVTKTFRIEEKPGAGRLGRHVEHDPRSLRYRLARAGTVASVAHERRIPILDQGDLGSCTGNAGTGALGASPVYDSLPSSVQKALNESYAVALYSAATAADDVKGTYKPDDTGSTGLAICKVLKTRGLVSGYAVATSADEMKSVIQSVPVIIGIPWFEGFDDPAAGSALVTISGSVRGGHEIVVDEYDLATDTFTAANSWGTSWGDAGRFRFTGETMQALFDQQADAYGFTLAGAPAPTPTPDPTPTPAPTPAPAAVWPEEADPWLDARHTEHHAVAAQKALLQLREALGGD